MKWSLTVKLSVLAVLIALAPTALVGWRSMNIARDILLEHELTDLSDETALQAYEMQSRIVTIRHLARNLARDYRVRELLLHDGPLPRPIPAPAQPQSCAEKILSELLQNNRFIIECWCVRLGKVQQPTVVLHQIEDPPGSKHIEDLPLLPLAGQGDLQKHVNEMVRAFDRDAPNDQVVLFPAEARPEKEGPPRVIMHFGVPIISDSRDLLGVLVLTVDFLEMTRALWLEMPRHLVFIADDQRRFLLHPDFAARYGTPAAITDLTTASEPEIDRSLNRTNKATLDPDAPFSIILLDSPGKLSGDKYAFWYVTRKLPPQEINENLWPEINKRLQKLAIQEKFVCNVLDFKTTELRVQCLDPTRLPEIQRQIDQLEEEYTKQPPQTSWDPAMRCKSFRISYARIPLMPQKEPGCAWFLDVILAAAEEEIYSDVHAKMLPMLVWILGTGAAAALLAWLFARWLVRPLNRIIEATAAFARGQYATNLPIKSKDEIGTLARTFVDMAQKVQQRDEQIREKEARLRAIFDTAAEGILVMTRKGRIESFNQAASQIFGYTISEAEQLTFPQLVTNIDDLPKGLIDENASTWDDCGSSLSKRLTNAQVMQITGRRKDGSTFPLEIAFRQISLGQRGLVTAILRDITERQKAQEELKHMNQQLESLNTELELRVQLRTEELQRSMTSLEVERGKLEMALQGAEQANRAKDTFLANMSHELRTPLNAIKGYTEMLIEQTADDGQPQYQSDLEKIHHSGLHLLDLINDILDLAKIASGKMPLDIHPFELARFLQELTQMTGPLARKKYNELEVIIPPGVGTMVSDEKRVRQILLNLLSNACKFCEKGKVTLAVERIRVNDEDWIVFTVSDTGIGIPANKLSHIFEPFEQADKTTSRKFGGTGLGLAISRNFSTLLGGEISVQSEVDKGSRFTVRLPAIRSVVEEGQLPTNPIPRTRSILAAARPRQANLVLVIDDDTAVRELMSRFLTRQGYQVITASNGAEGLRLAREQRPMVITLDIMMPAIDGWAVLTVLKSDPATADIPVILITIVEDRSRGFALGASDFLTKPISWDRLRSILDRHRQLSRSGSILVVEDDDASREIVVRMLVREGWSVREAVNGKEALERVADQPPVLILLDLMMPEMDGFTFLEELRKRPEGEHIPVVVVTAKDLTSYDCERLTGRVEQILQKGDAGPEVLLEAVRQRVASLGNLMKAATPG